MIRIHFEDRDDVSINSLGKRRISQFLSLRKKEDGYHAGTARVTYKPGYYNELEFDGIDDLKHKLWPCLERELVNEFTA